MQVMNDIALQTILPGQLYISRRQAGMLCNARKHLGSDFVSIMKREYDIAPSNP